MLDPDSPELSVGTVYWIDDMYLTPEKVWKTETSQGILARTGGNWFYQKLSSHGPWKKTEAAIVPKGQA